MSRKVLSVLLGSIFFVTLSSFTGFEKMSETAIDNVGDWERLGSRKVNRALDKDVIHVGIKDGRFKKLKLQVTGGSLNMHRMIVHYGNGTKEEIQLRHNFSRRSGSRVIDLKGNKRIIKKVVFFYDSKNLQRSRATMHLFGK